MGVSRLALLNYPYWDGRESYKAAESAAARQQWAEAEELTLAVLNVNPDHALARKLSCDLTRHAGTVRPGR